MSQDDDYAADPWSDDGPLPHGGNLVHAIALFGGVRADWLDLSTGINPRPYPVPDLAPDDWARLPDADTEARLLAAARRAYGVPATAQIVAAPGVSALIRLMPRLARPARVAIPSPTYNEHSAAFEDEGWEVAERPGSGTNAAVIVNPNTPDGQVWTADDLRLMALALDLLVVDETFMDMVPADSMIADAGEDSLVVLRSFGKFYGLAGVRLGFAVTSPVVAARLAAWLGPWAVSGPALAVGIAALSDRSWAEATRTRLAADRARLQALADQAGWTSVGGTDLFQTFDTGDAEEAQARLAAHKIWTRIFPYSKTWLRLGLPGVEADWVRLEAALG